MNLSVFIVGSPPGANKTLYSSAEAAGFANIKPFTGLGEVERALADTPNCFFLFAPTIEIKMLQDIVAPIRKYKRRDVRFSPLIYFCKSATPEIVQGCVSMGFDDVIAMPFTQPHFETRLMRQLSQKVTYCENGDYFGPMRPETLRLNTPSSSASAPKHIEFTRSLTCGVTHLSKDKAAA